MTSSPVGLLATRLARVHAASAVLAVALALAVGPGTSASTAPAGLPPSTQDQPPPGAMRASQEGLDADSAARLAAWQAQAATVGTVRIIVTLKAPGLAVGALSAEGVQVTPTAIQQRVLGRMTSHLSAVKTLTTWPVLAGRVDAEGLARLAADPDVASVELDQQLRPFLAESVPLIEADQQWAAGNRGAGWTVAIIDNGVDRTHPAFGGRVVSEACYSGGGSVSESLCPGGSVATTGPGAAAPCATCDGGSHGTHVAGTAAGSSGVAPAGTIIAVNVFSRGGVAYLSDMLAGLDRVYALRSTHNIAAVNLSLGGGFYSSTCDTASPSTVAAFAALRSVGIAPIVASGNDSSISTLSFPACLSNAVSVSASTKADEIASYANTASFLQVVAPGSSIAAPVIGGGTASMSGTSMATPHVSGAWALLRQVRPDANVDTVLAALKGTGVLLREVNGTLFPRIRVNAAANALGQPTVSVSPTAWSAPAGTGTGSISVTTLSTSTSWSVTTSASWLSATPSAGVGNGTVALSVSTNPTSAARSATATIGGRTVAVTQAAGTASFTVSPTTWSAPPAGGVTTLAVVASLSDAYWSASSSASWLSAQPASGIGSRTVTLTAATNATGAARSGTVSVAGFTVTVSQAAGASTFTVSPTAWSVPGAGGSTSVLVSSTSTSAAWSATSSQPWLTVSPAGSVGGATVSLVATANATLSARRATATIAGVAVTVEQAAGTPVFTVSPTRWQAPAEGGRQDITISSSDPAAPWSIPDLPASTSPRPSDAKSPSRDGASIRDTAAGRVASLAAGRAVDAQSLRLLAQWAARAGDGSPVRLIAGLRSGDASTSDVSPAYRATQQRVLASLNAGSRGRAYEGWPFLAVEVDATGLSVLAADPAVVTIEEDQQLEHQLADSVPLIEADQQWAAGYRGTGWAVAIIDNGVDRGHPAFGGRVVSEACYSGGGRQAESVCPGAAVAVTGPGSAAPCPTCTHGTHVAGTAAGINGVAPASDIIAVQVFSSGGLAYLSDILAGLDRIHALRHSYRIAAVNLSLGGGAYSSTCDASFPATAAAFSALRSAGIAPVVASGNNGSSASLSHPACVSSAVSVAASTKTDQIASYSNTSTFLQLLAPGSGIVAPVPGGGTAAMNGTSMASPHVAGAWALLRQMRPDADVTTILAALKATGRQVRQVSGVSFPRIRVKAAAEALRVSQITVTPTLWSAPAEGGVRTVTLAAASDAGTWSATSSAPWLSVSRASGAGSGQVVVTAAANPTPEVRTGVVTVAGLPVTVVQRGQWLNLQASTGRGTGTLTLTAAPNPGPWPRTMTTTVAGQAVTVSQAGAAVTQRYLAEGAASALFDTQLALLNPGGTGTWARLDFFVAGNTTPTEHWHWMPPSTRQTISPRQIVGNAAFSTVVTATQGLVVDRTMSWDDAGYGAHAETAAGSASPVWYFAEGATHSGFDLFYLLQNPAAVPVTARVRYLRSAGAPLVKTYVLAPHSRTNIWVNVEEFAGVGRALAAAEFSAVIETLDGTSIIAERAMYRSGQGRVFNAGHASLGVTAPSTRWFLAEGATGPYFDQFVLIANPSPTDAQVLVTYLLTDGRTFSRQLTAPANARSGIWVDVEQIPGVAGYPLADVALSMTLQSTNGVPIIVERSMWWPGTGATWHESHNSAGATRTASRWALAEGEVGGPRGVETYILIANTSPQGGWVRVRLLFEDGSSIPLDRWVPAQSRTNVAVAQEFGSAVLGRRFGAVIESIGTTRLELVVERAMYSNAGGVSWAAGTNAIGTPLP